MSTYAGKPTCSCGAKWFPAYVAHLATFGIAVRFLQLIGSYGASAGTHGGGLCFDLVVVQTGPRSLNEAYKIVVREARRMGADATWERPTNWDRRGGIRHVHGLGNGCPHLKAAAKNQQAAVRDDRNGLANNAPDPGPRPLSGRTWAQGIAWARAEDDRLGKWLLLNFAVASIARGRPGAWLLWLARRIRVVSIVRTKRPDVLGGLETGAGGAWHYISTKVKTFGYLLVVRGGGRALWRRKNTTGATTARGVYKPPAYKGNVKEVPWMVGPVGGAPMLTGLAHLDPDAPASFNATVIDRILDFLEAKAAEHDLGRSRIVLMIDTADKTGTVRKRILERGYASVFDVAERTVGRQLASMTYFRPAVTGPSVDDIFVWPTRPVEVASKTPPTKPTDLDHLPIGAILTRQKRATS